MELRVESNRVLIKDEDIKKKISKLYSLCLNESIKDNKVAFYYENIKTSNVICFNEDICFYAASTIKILVCLMILEQAENGAIDVNKEILVTMKDLKQGTGVLKNQKEDTNYTIIKLIELTIVESDNTAYLKLVELIGKDNIALYGKKLGARHTMEGKKTDSFGIINCNDMIIYWKKVKEYIDSHKKYSLFFKNILLNPSIKLIKDKSLKNDHFVRKYGSWDIAYHETGYVNSKNPYYLIVLTQLNKKNNKNKFINEVAKMLSNINDRIGLV